ncbi:MAG TPA: glycogen synthase GlgA [Burkholderiales bacterium]|nr:glycogen synthase GlgA [Burkholderiales bacterium]
MSASISILFVTPEVAPWIKTGGLGDVSSALPAALVALNCEVFILLPAYRSLRRLLSDAEEAAQIPERGGLPATKVMQIVLPSGVRLLLLDAPTFYDRPGGPYQNEAGKDWADNDLRFGCLSHAAAWIATHGLLDGWRPQLLHCHDWQAGLAPAYLRFDSPPKTKVATVFTIHNLAFQGLFPASSLARLGLPPESFGVDGLEYYGQLSFLKGALQYADAITTVSPTYASEIQQAELGFGMNGLLHARRDVLHGITNGIDIEEWNPATDRHLASPYDSDRLGRKAANKAALQKRMGLPLDDAIPLFAAVSRMTSQKGTDLIMSIAPRLRLLPSQLVLLGSGEADLEQGAMALAASHPKSVAVKIGFDESLAHLIEAGADFFLMPSRFEPCGLNQMYSQRYGTPPIARATGGLADTVVDATPENIASGRASGFLFAKPEADDLFSAVQRAIRVYDNPANWARLRQTAMQRDFSWTASALRYRALFAELIV